VGYFVSEDAVHLRWRRRFYRWAIAASAAIQYNKTS